MRTPGRRLPASCPTRRHQNRLTRAVRWIGRLLCWSLAVGMTTAATELLLTPEVGWWPLPWYLTCSIVLAWAILRAREKTAQHLPDEDTLPDQWGQAA